MSKKKKSFAEMKKEAILRKPEKGVVPAETPETIERMEEKTGVIPAAGNTDTVMQLAIQHFRSGNLREAERLLSKILPCQPENAEILYILGVIYFQLKQYDRAVHHISKSIEIDKSQSEAYALLAVARQKQGNLEQASIYYQKSLELNLADMETERIRIGIVITGTGRCGTGYMANLLTSAGLPCGHENIFSLTINKGNLMDNGKANDSSWLAAPLLRSSCFNEAAIIHAVRHPLDTIESFRAIKFFTEKNLFYLYVERVLPELKMLDPDRAPFYFFIEWTKMILKYEDDERYIRQKVEDDPVSLIKRLGGNITNLYSDTKYNTRRSDKIREELTVHEIPNEYKTEFLEISEKIGYELL
jgi:tetratricopeptide (TPR) repeat protein